MTCPFSEADRIAFVQGELAPDEARIFGGHVTGCAECGAEVRAVRWTLEATRRDAAPAAPLPPDLFDRILEAVDRETGAAAPDAADPRGLLLPRGRLAGAAAALVLFAAALALLVHRSADTASPGFTARIAFADGEVRLLDADRILPPGARVPDRALLRVSGAARIDVPGARVALRDAAAAFRRGAVELLTGTLAVEARRGLPFEVQTLHGSVKVRGTRFLVTEGPDATQVSVSEGRVVLEGTGVPLVLSEGEVGRLARGRAARSRGDPGASAWARVLSADAVYLEMDRPDPARPALLVFRLTNVADQPLLLPAFDPNKPRFSLKIRSGEPPREGVVNLARFHVPTREPDAGEEGTTVLLNPGKSLALAFDVGPLLWEGGEYAVTGVYQAAEGGRGQAWAGRAFSETHVIHP